MRLWADLTQVTLRPRGPSELPSTTLLAHKRDHSYQRRAPRWRAHAHGVCEQPTARRPPPPRPQVDTAFVGRLGLVPLASLGPNAALFNVVFFLCFTSLAVICVQSMASAHSRGDAGG